MTSILEVKNLVKKYGDLTAVKGISFEIQKGEIFSLLGPNGSAKTTTVRLLNGANEATSGQARVLDLDPSIFHLGFRIK